MGLPLSFAYGPEFSKYGELKSPDSCPLFVLSWLGLGPMMKCECVSVSSSVWLKPDYQRLLESAVEIVFNKRL